ncbi:hypothetical protein A8C32_09485 [Flavivirga aquatica]|uniref:Uncharacterized protein n=1 Tax=Flavivirga aquatica TaxID=1849968 RepID=A0A1E5SJT9_9FLAO|nr:hypothetical protein A8C32_09485 [Flavivirga aquatica]
MHDPRVGRFFAVDPLAPEYPHNSPYAFSENRVIDRIEREGLESSFYMLGMKEIDGGNYFQLVEVHQVGQGMESVVGKKIGGGIQGKNYVKGSDGHWHVLPDKILNQSTDKLGANVEEVFNILNQGDIADSEAEMGGALKVMEELGGKLEMAMGVFFLYDGFRNIAKNGKKILGNAKRKKPKIIIGIADEQIPKVTSADIKLKNVMEGSDYNLVSYKNTSLGDIDVDGFDLVLDITVPKDLRRKGVLSAVMKASVDKYNPTRIIGTWKRNFNGKPSTNYTSFMKNRKTMSTTNAALNTPTGRAAQKAGYGGTPIVDESADGIINVIFTPSKQ